MWAVKFIPIAWKTTFFISWLCGHFYNFIVLYSFNEKTQQQQQQHRFLPVLAFWMKLNSNDHFDMTTASNELNENLNINIQIKKKLFLWTPMNSNSLSHFVSNLIDILFSLLWLLVKDVNDKHHKINR